MGCGATTTCSATRRRHLRQRSEHLAGRRRHLVRLADLGRVHGSDRPAKGEPQGLINPTLYSLANDEYGKKGSKACNSSNKKTSKPNTTCIFYDVTLGDNDVNCLGTVNCYLPSGTAGVLSTSDSDYEPAYGTGKGYDFATGIGTVNVANLVNAWP